MGAERKHWDREVRLQGDWKGGDPSNGMPDHYTKSKMAITLGMVSSLVRDLKAGWRPGPKAAPDLVAIDLKVPEPAAETVVVSDQEDDPTHAQTEADRDSDASDLAEISAPSIDFYIQNMPDHLRKLVSPDPPKLHVRALDDPRVPACARLRKQGVRIAEMVCLGNFPAAMNEICFFCRQKRPEIMEQLDGHKVEKSPGDTF